MRILPLLAEPEYLLAGFQKEACDGRNRREGVEDLCDQGEHPQSLGSAARSRDTAGTALDSTGLAVRARRGMVF